MRDGWDGCGGAAWGKASPNSQKGMTEGGNSLPDDSSWKDAPVAQYVCSCYTPYIYIYLCIPQTQNRLVGARSPQTYFILFYFLFFCSFLLSFSHTEVI